MEKQMGESTVVEVEIALDPLEELEVVEGLGLDELVHLNVLR